MGGDLGFLRREGEHHGDRRSLLGEVAFRSVGSDALSFQAGWGGLGPGLSCGVGWYAQLCDMLDMHV